MVKSAEQLNMELRTHGGIATIFATIEHNFPHGKGLLFDNTTLELVRPRAVHSLDEAGDDEIIVVPDKPWVLDEVEVAVKMKQELGLAENLHAMLPSGVRVFARRRPGVFYECGRSEVNYICIRGFPPDGGKR